MLFQHSNGLDQEVHKVHMVRGPHGGLELDHWSAVKVDLILKRNFRNWFLGTIWLYLMNILRKADLT